MQPGNEELFILAQSTEDVMLVGKCYPRHLEKGLDDPRKRVGPFGDCHYLHLHLLQAGFHCKLLVI